MESHDGTCVIRFAHDLDRLVWLALGIFLHEHLALTMNLGLQIVGKCIHTGHTHTVETTGHLVAVLAELTAGMEHRQNDLESRTVLLLVHAGRNTSAIVLYCDGIVFVDEYFDVGTIACKSLVDTVVNHLIHKMMETPFTDITDVHRRSLPHGLKTFQNLNTVRGVLLRRSVVYYFFAHFYIFTIFPIKAVAIIATNKRTNLAKILQTQANSGCKIETFFSVQRVALNGHVEKISASDPEGQTTACDILRIQAEIRISRYDSLLYRHEIR